MFVSQRDVGEKEQLSKLEKKGPKVVVSIFMLNPLPFKGNTAV